MKRKVLLWMLLFPLASLCYDIMQSDTAMAAEVSAWNSIIEVSPTPAPDLDPTTTQAPNYLLITKYPSQMMYSKGEALDLSDMVVQGYYSDGFSRVISDYEITGYDSNLIGYQTIYINYQGVYVTLGISVIPATVTNISVDNYDTSSVTFSWDEVPGASRYEIYYIDQFFGTRTLASIAYTNNITLYNPAATVLNMQICVVENVSGQEYKGYYSDVFTAATAPETVSGLFVTGTTKSSVNLSWNKVAGATGYIIYRSNASKENYSICDVTDKIEYSDKKLSSGNGYHYKVVAYTYSEDFTGAASEIVDTSTCPAETALKCKAGDQKVRISWNKVTGATDYDIYIGNSISGYALVTTRKASVTCQYTIEALTNGQTYDIYIIAKRDYNGIIYSGQPSKSITVSIEQIAPTSTKAKLYSSKEDFLNSVSYTEISFFRKSVKYSKSFVIPGLINTNVGGFTCTTMCPQAIAFADDYLLQTAYDMTGEENSVIYVIDKSSKKLLTTLVLPSKAHLGGIAYDGKNVWVTRGTIVSSIPLTDIIAAIKDGSSYTNIKLNTSSELGITASYLTYYDKKLWVGAYNELEQTNMYSYTIDNKNTTPVLTKADTITMPTRVQGVVFTSKGELILSRSCQLYKGLRGYMRQIDVYKPDFEKAKDGSIPLGDLVNTVEMPSMGEGIAISSTYLYVTFESAAFVDASFQMDRICAFKLTDVTKKADA